MILIRTRDEFKANYQYPNHMEKKDWPRKYPCVLVKEDHDGGLGGPYVTHKIVYFPNGVDEESFFKGMEAARKVFV